MSLLRRITAGVGALITDAWGVQKISSPFSLFHSTFTFDIPVSWIMYESGAQVASSTVLTSVGGEAIISATAALPDNHIESRPCSRYQPNRGHLYSTALICPNKTVDGIREWGLGTDENKVIFRLKSDGLLYAVLRSGDVETIEELIDTSVIPNFDIEKGNLYDIQFQWRGTGNFKFFIGTPTNGQSKLVHEFKLLGTLTKVSLENPAMPAYFRATRITEDVQFSVGCVDITSENGGQLDTNYTSAYSETVSVSGADNPTLVLKIPLQIAGQTNTRSIVAVRISVKATKKGTFKLWVTRNPADITGATFVALGEGSFIETDSPDITPGAVRATAVTVANMQFVTAIAVEPNVRIAVESPADDSIKLIAVRGDFIVVTSTLSGAGTADTVLEWGEEE